MIDVDNLFKDYFLEKILTINSYYLTIMIKKNYKDFRMRIF